MGKEVQVNKTGGNSESGPWEERSYDSKKFKV